MFNSILKESTPKETTLKESTASQLQIEISKAINKVDEELSYKDFAKAVALVIKDEYGTHNIKPFLDELKKGLK